MSLPEIIETLKAKLWSPTLTDIYAEKVVLCSGAYDAEDVVSESATAGTPWVFEGVAKKNGGSGYITAGLLVAETTAIAGWFTLFMFKERPTCALNDDAANTAPLLADRKIYLGRIDFPACGDLGTGMSGAVATASTVGNLPMPFVCCSESCSLYGVLVIRNAVDLADSTVLQIKLTIEQY